MMAEATWPVVRLGNHAYIKGRIGWRGLTASEYTDEGPYLIAGQHLTSGLVDWATCDHLSVYRYEESHEIALKQQDIILTKDGTIGRVAFIDHLPGPATINSTMMLVRPREPVQPKFLYHYLTGHHFQKLVADKVSGSSIPHIFQRDMVNLTVPLPSEAEQRRIAEILDAADDAIRQTERVIAKLRQVKAGLLHDLLTRGLDAQDRLRDPDAHPEQFKDSPLGRIPREWESGLLGEICKQNGGSIQIGPFGSQLHAKDYQKQGIPIITVEHLGDNEILHCNLPLVGKSDYLRLQKYSLETGDLVFSRVGSIDRCAYVSERENGWLFSGRCLRVRPGKQNLNACFLSYQLNGYHARQWILNNSVGSTMKCLNTTILSNVPVVIPQSQEQFRIAATLDAADARIRAEEATLAKLRQVKRGLSDDLLTGKVRVSL